jgi:hypothetical protein
MSGTPIYRVRNFVDAEDAKRYIFANATDQYIGTIVSYYIVAKGTEVEGLYRKEISRQVIWI